MTESTFEIRVCESCGLRYPLVGGQSFGTRCPTCMGTTQIILRRELILEPIMTPTSTTAAPSPQPMGGIAVLLDNLRSAWNVGSIFRSADGFGFTHAYLCGFTPTPDRPAREAIQKTALGAEESIPWSYHKDAVILVTGLKREGWRIIGLEEHLQGISIEETPSPGGNNKPGVVLIVGNEITGVDPGLLELCDQIMTIPMRGEKKSLNAAIAFGVAAYALTISR